MVMSPKRAVLAAGGTGGHMFPAQALCDALKAKGWEIALMTDARGFTHAGAIAADVKIEVKAQSISPRKPIKAVKGVFQLWRGCAQAKKFLRQWKPDIVIGFGGYPAFPAMWAAQKMKIPTILHEQNTVLGRVNRVFAAKADAVVSGFDVLEKLPNGANWKPLGNPLRAPIMAASERKYKAPTKSGLIHILIVGGSLGAKIISDTMPTAIASLPVEIRSRLRVVQQTKQDDVEAVRGVYKSAGIDALCQPFFTDIETHLAKAHYCIARAGASSVSEILAMGLPSLLIPLAIAMDDHQTINARILEKLNCADLLPQSLFTPERVTQILTDRILDENWLRDASTQARSGAKLDATDALAELVVRTADPSAV